MSTAGKSTLAAALCKQGCSFVADDICVIGLNNHGKPIVQSDGRQLKLSPESIAKLGLNERRREPVRDTMDKYYIQPFGTTVESPTLSAIYVLRLGRPTMQPNIKSLTIPDAMRMLEFETNHSVFFANLRAKPEMVAQRAAILGHTKVFLLVRPRGFQHMDETVATLQAHWESLAALST
jgi:hypothetical protein